MLIILNLFVIVMIGIFDGVGISDMAGLILDRVTLNQGILQIIMALVVEVFKDLGFWREKDIRWKLQLKEHGTLLGVVDMMMT